MTTYTIDWSDNASLPPVHSGLDTKTMQTMLQCNGVMQMKERVLSSLDDVKVKSNKHVHSWELNPLGCGKVELRGKGQVFVGWITIGGTNV